MTAAVGPARFPLPPGRAADAPPERRGTPRDGVRLLRAAPGRLTHHRFRDLPDLLDPGDLLVVNTSGTLPAALPGRRTGGDPLPVHVAGALEDGAWVVEPRRPDGSGPAGDVAAGDRLTLPGPVHLDLVAPYPAPTGSGVPRLWRAIPHPVVDLVGYLRRHGRPIRYGYLSGDFPLSDYQTIFARQPGSAEMPSAGRPFTPEVLVRCAVRGVVVAPVLLHTGVSSPEWAEPPAPERFAVPPATARLVTATRAAGARVVAVGTTVVRALESAVVDGAVRPRAGWTELVLGPERPAHVVSGLVTGLHTPEASHLRLLDAVAGPALVDAAYAAALAGDYRWHEFGDAMLFLPA
ncbi:MAG: S-adenosylmethionine:tRNA ribosyltransferase-isomerase [Actinomycetota bacterium]